MVGLKLEVWENLYGHAERWTNRYGHLVHSQPDLYTDETNSTYTHNNNGTAPSLEPTSVFRVHSFEAPVDTVKDGAQRISGIFVVPVTGQYIFHLASDDAGMLYLNPTGSTEDTAVMIAEVGDFLGRPGFEDGD
eukprot:SAG11_NODE_21705_length_420_cov_0.647975_1_plen_133_part_10